MRIHTSESSFRNSRRVFLQRLGLGLCAPVVLEGISLAEGAARSAGPTASDSDVGSLFPFVQSQALRGDFPLSYLNPRFRGLNSWKRKAREKVLELLHYAPQRCDPCAETVERIDKGEYVREKVYFNTTPEIRVPACVLVPKGGRKPAPAIVALHDHGAFYFWGKEKLVDLEQEHPVMRERKQKYYAGHGLADTLARQGYVVVVIDAFYWGERRMVLDNDLPDWHAQSPEITAERLQAFNQRANQSEDVVARTLYATGLTWSGISVWDDIRTVDYLVTRPEVDKKRIGCIGLSMGGYRSCQLAAMDERIKAAVVVGWMASYPAQLKRRVRSTIGNVMLVPGLYQQLDYPDVASLAMPNALLVINGSQDRLFDLGGVQACFDKLAACYRKAGVPEKFRSRMYDAPHEFNAEMQTEAWDWLKRWV